MVQTATKERQGWEETPTTEGKGDHRGELKPRLGKGRLSGSVHWPTLVGGAILVDAESRCQDRLCGSLTESRGKCLVLQGRATPFFRSLQSLGTDLIGH